MASCCLFRGRGPSGASRPDFLRIPGARLCGAALLLVLLLPGAGCRRQPAPAAHAPDDARTTPATAATQVDWCAGHGVPESICTRCNPGLSAAFKARGDWCAEHGLPESQCTLCNPGLKFAPPAGATGAVTAPPPPAGGADHAAAAGPPIADGSASPFCHEHQVSEAECAICLPDLATTLAAFRPEPGGQELRPVAPGYPRVRLASAAVAGQAGLRAVRAGATEPGSGVTGAAEVVADADHASTVASPVAGVVRALRVNAGDRVTAGQVLAVLSSEAVGEARAAYRRADDESALARQEAERGRALRQRQVLSARELEALEARERTAAAALAAARARLGALSQGAPLAAESEDPAEYLLRAPRAGEVAARHALPGQVVAAGDTLLELTDRAHLCLEIALAPAQAASVRAGQRLTFTADGAGGRAWSGQVLAVAPVVDARRRTVTVRAALDPTTDPPRPHQFGLAELAGPGGERVTLIPLVSLLQYGGHPIAFVRRAADLYEVRPLVTGARRAEMIEVRAGVTAGEEVVTDGAFLLKTQISKGSIGAGCCDLPANKH